MQMPNLFVNIDMILSNGFVSVDSVPLILPFYFLFLFVLFIEVIVNNYLYHMTISSFEFTGLIT